MYCTCRKSTEKKRKHPLSELPDGSGWGDHIQLLQIYEKWDQANYDPQWCVENDLQVLSLSFLVSMSINVNTSKDEF